MASRPLKTESLPLFALRLDTCDSVVLLNQIRTVDKTRLKRKIGEIPDSKMLEIDEALKISLGL